VSASQPDPGPGLSIGRLSDLTSVPITTLRYYEKRGLIDPPARLAGRRRYGPEVVMRLMVIRFCKVAGLTLAEIRTVLADRSPDRVTTRRIASDRIAAIEQQIERLEMARLMLDSARRCRCPSVEACSCGAMDEAVARMRSSLQ
jgi:DNA-binding transcriptional MerR regulator